jgi:hypothetical protein
LKYGISNDSFYQQNVEIALYMKMISCLQLVRIFQEQKEFEKKGRLQEFDPECAIFVCNKWDQVPPKEERGVWDDIAKKIKDHWPTRRDIDITEQMFKMSTTEVS